MSDTLPVPSQPAWKVVGQASQLVTNGQGQYVPGYRVTAQVLASGSTFYVDIPASTYNAGTIKAMLTDAYQHVSAVDNLEG